MFKALSHIHVYVYKITQITYSRHSESPLVRMMTLVLKFDVYRNDGHERLDPELSRSQGRGLRSRPERPSQ